MNLEIIGGNIAEAIEELVRLQGDATNGTLTEEAFQVGLLHAYYASLTQQQFDEWNQYPSNIEKL